MAPPPLPFFRGAQISAAEEKDLLVVRPRGGLEFSEPAGTTALYLPRARLVAAVVELYEGEGAAVRFDGDFSRVDRGTEEFLGVLSVADAEALVAALAARYGLPRAPRPCPRAGLHAAPIDTYIEVEGTYRPEHFEAANFEGVMLRPPRALEASLVAGGFYRVRGFVEPGAAPGSMVIGYRGPTLRAVQVELV